MYESKVLNEKIIQVYHFSIHYRKSYLKEYLDDINFA